MSPLLGASIEMLGEGWVFYPLALLSVVGAFSVLLARNPIYGAMALVATFFGIAGIYVVLSAHLIAALQIMVYAGAIMVLFLFVIMLLSLTEQELGRERITLWKILGGAAAFAIAAGAYVVFEGGPQSSLGTLPPGFGTVAGVGKVLFTQYVLPFEATSILLLAAIVGAVVVAKRRI